MQTVLRIRMRCPKLIISTDDRLKDFIFMRYGIKYFKLKDSFLKSRYIQMNTSILESHACQEYIFGQKEKTHVILHRSIKFQ